MKILLFTSYYLPGFKGGGPIKTIANLVYTTSDLISYKIVTSDRDLGDDKAYSMVTLGQWNLLDDNLVFYTDKGIRGLNQIANAVLNKDYDIIYLNSFFSVRFSLIPLLFAKLVGKPVILAPRGEFSAGALSMKTFKKNKYIKLYKLLKLNRGVLFQASSEFELTDIKEILGKKNKYFVAENIGSKQYANTLEQKQNNALNIVFLSRISPMKNLMYALNVLSQLTNSVSFDIYGPIEDEPYWNECKKIIAKMPKHIKISYKSHIPPIDVVETLSAYDLFFMPTKGENYGHVIAEALCAGLPILIADTTPWRNLQAQGIGWDLPLNKPEVFSATIDRLAEMPIQEHHKMREKVLAWAEKKFSQKDVIEANIAMFEYAANKQI